MKKFMITLLLINSFIQLNTLFELEKNEGNRMLHNDSFHQTGNVLLRVTNYGLIGSRFNGYPSLTWPKNPWFDEIGYTGGIDYLSYGALWVGAKKVRRNLEGQKLYWRQWPNPANENDCIPDTHPDWNPDLKLVVDTLTSVGYDGDRNLYELLPAYNPLEASNTHVEYTLYNSLDRVFFWRYGESEFDDNALEILQETGYPHFPIDNVYCSGLGSESSVAYYFDYSPFPQSGYWTGLDPFRHGGSHTEGNHHYPLEIAIKQETFTWPVQYFSDVIFMKHTIYNASEVDTLYDVSLGFLMDIFIEQAELPSIIPPYTSTLYLADNDISFPYSYELHYPGKLALAFLNSENNDTCWFWEIGDGPDDFQPININPTGATANEKYWLMTGRNPDTENSTSGGRYWNLKDDVITPLFGGVRYLHSVYGDMQGFDNPTEQSINIGPGEYKKIVSAIFLADSEEELINLAHLINEFDSSGFDESLMEGLPSIPRLLNVDFYDKTAALNWRLYTIPDELYIYYKLSDAPAYTWEQVQVDPANTSYTLYELAENEDYKFKLGAYFGSVYLESNTIAIGSVSDPHPISAKNFVSIYPNPFNASANIAFELIESSSYTISIFNSKGQKVYTFSQPEKVVGKQLYQWDGKDSNDNQVNSGIYLFQVETDYIKPDVKKGVYLK